MLFTKMNTETAFQVCRLIPFASRKETQYLAFHNYRRRRRSHISVCTVEWGGLLTM